MSDLSLVCTDINGQTHYLIRSGIDGPVWTTTASEATRYLDRDPFGDELISEVLQQLEEFWCVDTFCVAWEG